MKENAPEKIYISNFDIEALPKNEQLSERWHEVSTQDTDIEYTRTDAFIERVINFLNYKLDDVVATRVPGTIIPHHIAKQELFEDFRNYIKGDKYEKRY